MNAFTDPQEGSGPAPEPHYPFHDEKTIDTSCGRLCLYRNYRKRINLSTSLSGQALGVKK